MFDVDLFNGARARLETDLTTAPPADSLPVDTYVARSALQKAIRRGMTDLALRAASTLLIHDPRTLWRRLLVTALEDIGPGGIDLTEAIVASWRDRPWRTRMGGDWIVLSHLVSVACGTARCQSANHLFALAMDDSRAGATWRAMDELGFDRRAEVAGREQSEIVQRGVAALSCLGIRPGLDALIDGDAERLCDPFHVDLSGCREATVYLDAYRLSREALAMLNLVLARRSRLAPPAQSNDDHIPPVSWSGAVPTFVLDQYTRGGKAALVRFTAENRPFRNFVDQWGVRGSDRAKAAGELLFRVEGAAVTRRRGWPLGKELDERSAAVGCFLPEDVVGEGKALIERELPHLDALRSGYLPT